MGLLDIFVRQLPKAPTPAQGMRAPLPPETVEAIYRYADQGWAQTDIAAELEINHATVSRYLKNRAAATAATPAAAAPTSPVGTMKEWLGVFKELGLIVDKAAVAPAIPDARYTQTAEDLIEEERVLRYRAALKRPDVQEALDQQIIAELTGGTGGRRSPMANMRAMVQEAKELLEEVGGEGSGGGSTLEQLLRVAERYAPVVERFLTPPAAGAVAGTQQQYSQQQTPSLTAAVDAPTSGVLSAGEQEPPLTVAGYQGLRLLGIFAPGDIRVVLAIPSPRLAAAHLDEAIRAALAASTEEQRTAWLDDFYDFLEQPQVYLLGRGFLQDANWDGLRQSLGDREAWLSEFFAALGRATSDLLSADDDPGDAEDGAEGQKAQP